MCRSLAEFNRIDKSLFTEMISLYNGLGIIVRNNNIVWGQDNPSVQFKVG